MARKGTGYRVGAGASISISSGDTVAGSGFGGKVRSTTRSAKALKRSDVKRPIVNLDNKYGITNTRVNNRSAVTGPTGPRANPPSAQGQLTRKAKRQVQK